MNIYSNPEKFGLQVVGDVDYDDGYEFDMFVVWTDPATKQLYYSEDSGCSCPSPFEDHDRTTIIPATKHEVISAIRKHYKSSRKVHYESSRGSWDAAVALIEKVMMLDD